MNNTEKNIDKLIREALSEEESQAYDELAEQSLMEMMFGVFRGRHRFLSIMWALVSMVFFVGAIYSAVRFLETDVTNELIKWGAIFFFTLGTVLSLKVWYWMEMNKNTMMREIKRVELTVAHLASQLESK